MSKSETMSPAEAVALLVVAPPIALGLWLLILPLSIAQAWGLAGLVNATAIRAGYPLHVSTVAVFGALHVLYAIRRRNHTHDPRPAREKLTENVIAIAEATIAPALAWLVVGWWP